MSTWIRLVDLQKLLNKELEETEEAIKKEKEDEKSSELVLESLRNDWKLYKRLFTPINRLPSVYVPKADTVERLQSFVDEYFEMSPRIDLLEKAFRTIRKMEPEEAVRMESEGTEPDTGEPQEQYYISNWAARRALLRSVLINETLVKSLLPAEAGRLEVGHDQIADRLWRFVLTLEEKEPKDDG